MKNTIVILIFALTSVVAYSQSNAFNGKIKYEISRYKGNAVVDKYTATLYFKNSSFRVETDKNKDVDVFNCEKGVHLTYAEKTGKITYTNVNSQKQVESTYYQDFKTIGGYKCQRVKFSVDELNNGVVVVYEAFVTKELTSTMRCFPFDFVILEYKKTIPHKSSIPDSATVLEAKFNAINSENLSDDLFDMKTPEGNSVINQILSLGNKQILTTRPYQKFYLYAGDVLKFEVNGENKKFDIHFGAGYSWTDVTKVNDITTHSIKISKDGVYTIGWMAGAFKKYSEVSLIRIPAKGKENSSTVAPENNEQISVNGNNIYKGSKLIGAYTVQNMNGSDLYKITNASGNTVAKFVASIQPVTSGPSVTKIEIYKVDDVVGTSTPLKLIENTNFDRADQMRNKAIKWLVENGYL
ncbi:MAG: hypothetical protein K1X81_11225 [Bacteroidia bacterium]|nr:hypothetical protein [Bacteroidia bacterium]